LRRGAELRRARGYTMLVVAVLTAAALLIVLASISLGGAEREQATLEEQEALALSLAERGLERTKAYLAAILESEPDLDLALDPSLDDACAAGPPFTVTDPSGDDHLPPFTDPGAGPVTLAGWGGAHKGRFTRVPWPSAGAPRGAYLVRIDDDDDDQGLGFPTAQLDHPAGTSCREGPALTAPASNPVRDRDRTVVITSMGVAPRADPDSASVRKVVRAVVGKREMAGLTAGGPVDVSGSAELCGPFANVQATGSVDVRRMCASGCGLACPSPGELTARTSDAACTRGDGGPCIASADPPPVVPPVSSADRQWRPLRCAAPPCTPYYQLTTRGAAGSVSLRMWNYAACPDPRACASDPTLCPCWRDVSADTVDGGRVFLDDADPGLDATSPAPAHRAGDAAYAVFALTTGGSATLACPAGTPAPVSDAVYRYAPTPIHFPPLPPVLPRLPHGVWLIDGQLLLEAAADMPSCPAGWKGASLVARGSVVLHDHSYSLRPPPGLEAVLVAGGDLEFQTGNTRLDACGSGAAVVVAEQAKAQGTNELFAPLLVRDDPSCFADVGAGAAVDFGGNMTLRVDAVPLLAVEPLSTLSWSESTL